MQAQQPMQAPAWYSSPTMLILLLLKSCLKQSSSQVCLFVCLLMCVYSTVWLFSQGSRRALSVQAMQANSFQVYLPRPHH